VQMQEAPVALVGDVMTARPVNVDGKLDHYKVAVMAISGTGATEVKIFPDDYRALDISGGTRVAWMVRPGAWRRNNDSGFFCSFVSLVDAGFADALLSALRVTA
jgi:hypothetical protein